MTSITPTAAVVSAILMVVVLIIALKLRGKIEKNEESGNEFFPWERSKKMKEPDITGEDNDDHEDYGDDEDDEDDDEEDSENELDE